MKKHNYCTLFNFKYLSRGLALYESLCNVHDEFCLYIFAFDSRTKELLLSMQLDKAVIIGLEEFEDEELLAVKPLRTDVEYCWTCTPSTIKYAIEKFNLAECTYLDADLYFYSSPESIFNELTPHAVGLTPHNYSHEYDLSKTSGKYCVQFVFFRDSTQGKTPLDWWRKECINWCFSYAEGDKFGDQKYLDHFQTKFHGVHDIHNPGAGIAPWNILKFSFISKNKQIIIRTKEVEEFLIFYHFHKLKVDFKNMTIWLGKWFDFKTDVFEIVYKPYIERLLYYENSIEKTDYHIGEFKIIKSNRIELMFFYTVQRFFGQSNFFRVAFNKLNYIVNKIIILRTIMNEKYNDTALHFDKLTLPGILKRFLQSGPVSIADLGCGDGPWFNLLFKEGYISDEKTVFAVDLEIDRLRRVQDNFPWITVLACPADEIPMIKSGSLDWVISTMVMEHVLDEPKYIKEIARLLKPHGKAYLSTVYKRKWAWYFRKRHGESVLDTSHLREYADLNEFKLLVTEKGGFTILALQISQMWFPLFDPILFRVGKYIRLNKIVIKLLRMVKVPIPGYYELRTVFSKKASSAD